MSGEPKDAATVVLLRDGAGLETFLLRRTGRAAFMAGASVFPGGKLDDDDLAPGVPLAGLDARAAATLLGEPDDEARALGLYVAGIRETFEEAGVLFDDAEAAASRTRAFDAADRASFGACVRRLGTRLRLDALVPYARWITPPIEMRRFDARFFLAVVPDGQVAAHDGGEATEGAWMGIAEAMRAADEGRIVLAPPTLRTLYDLARFTRAEDALAAARARKPPRIAPEVAREGGTMVLTLPGDRAHSVAEAAFGGPTRMVLDGGRFRFA